MSDDKLRKEQAEEVLRNMRRMNDAERQAVATIINNVAMVSQMVEQLQQKGATA